MTLTLRLLCRLPILLLLGMLSTLSPAIAQVNRPLPGDDDKEAKTYCSIKFNERRIARIFGLDVLNLSGTNSTLFGRGCIWHLGKREAEKSVFVINASFSALKTFPGEPERQRPTDAKEVPDIPSAYYTLLEDVAPGKVRGPATGVAIQAKRKGLRISVFVTIQDPARVITDREISQAIAFASSVIDSL